MAVSATSTYRDREAVRLAVARAKARAVAYPKAAQADIEDLGFAIDVLCDLIAHYEFHREGS